MQFQTKDLLVTVLPQAGLAEKELANLCLLRTYICRHPTFCIRGSFGCHYGVTLVCKPCTWLGTICAACSLQGTVVGCHFGPSCGGGSACDPTVACGISSDPWVVQNPEDLVAIRSELEATLKSLEGLEKELPSAVGSKAEAAALERGLTEALDQVRAAKKNLK